MGRPEETVWWDQVTKLSDGRLSCKYCGKEFKGGVPRIKLHLSCRGGNIGPCQGVPSEIQEKAEEVLGEDTSVGKVNRDKALQASPMKQRKHTSVGEHGDGVDVAETGETSYVPANVMPSPSSSIGVAALFQVLSSFFNNCESTTNRATQEYAADVPSFTRAEELQANLNLMNKARNTSVGKVKRDKALEASPMKRRRHTSVGELGDGVNVAETGETNNMPSANCSLDMAALVQVPASYNNFLTTTNGGSREYLVAVDSCMQEEASQANPKEQVRYPSIGGDNNGVNVAETGRTSSLALNVVERGDTNGINVAVRGETSYTPATAMPSTGVSLEIEALPRVSSTYINNYLSTETSVEKVKVWQMRAIQMEGDSNGVNVYKTGETSNMPAIATHSENYSLETLFSVPSLSVSQSTLKGGSREYVANGPSLIRDEESVGEHSEENGGSQECVADVASKIQDKTAEEMRGETSVGKVNRDKAWEASPMERARYVWLRGDSNVVNVNKLQQLNCVLKEREKSLCLENIWRDHARTNEPTLDALRSNLAQCWRR